MPLFRRARRSPDADPTTTPKALLRFATVGSGRGRILTIAVLGLALHQVTEALVPVFIGVVIDRAIAPADPLALGLMLCALALLFVVLTFAWRLSARQVTRVFTAGEHDLRLLAARRILHPRGLAERRAAGQVLAVTAADSSNVAGLAWVFAEIGASSAAVLTTVVALFLISWPLAALVIVATLVQLLVIHLLSAKLDERAAAEQDRAAEAGALATDLVAGLRVVKGLGAEPVAASRYHAASRRAMRAAIRAADADARLSAVGGLGGGVTLALVAVIAAWFALGGVPGFRISVGDLVAVVGLAQFVRSPMEYLGYFGGYLAAKRGSARRLSALLRTGPAVPERATSSPDAETVRAATGDASAPLQLELCGTRVVVPGGSLVGIDAGSAADALLDRFAARAPLATGELIVDGVDVAGIDPAALRRIIAAPPHDAAVFSGSVRDNLFVEEVDDALLAIAGLDEVLEHLSDGLDSSVGEQGRFLSGGQRQRLLLARTLSQGHRFVVLHEPTSSVDTLTEDRIATGLAAHAGATGRSIVLLTSSPTLLANCSSVVVLDAGELALADAVPNAGAAR
ncbi:ABC transporter ATP-binding protein/permease [Plantibacter flavus]|uniref:ABC transporter transmembrane domain-containing protein n=1 Tax=Plantibacter flavus TaxID=150123 RepID=UPI003F1460C7